MLRFFSITLIAALVTLGLPAQAEGGERLGYGRLVNNDFYGDGHDRGHTGSIASSRVYGRTWSGSLSHRPGDLIEYRINGGIMAPIYLDFPLPGDRPYAGYLSLGAHTHFQAAGFEMSTGADLFITGPQTRLGDLQSALHDGFLGLPPSRRILNNQIRNGVYPSALVEVARDIPLGGRTSLRPFVEGRWGVETFVRAGFDLTFGQVGQGELLVRDYTTGQRYRVVQRQLDGFSFTVGADVAAVRESVFLPKSRGYQLTDRRHRARLGMHWQNGDRSIFYGLTWLGKEFTSQPTDQVVGSLRLNLTF